MLSESIFGDSRTRRSYELDFESTLLAITILCIIIFTIIFICLFYKLYQDAKEYKFEKQKLNFIEKQEKNITKEEQEILDFLRNDPEKTKAFFTFFK